MSDESNKAVTSDLNSILTLTEATDGISNIELNNEMLKINNLIKSKYYLTKKNIYFNNKNEEKKFIDIKNSTFELNNNIKNKTFQLTSSIESQKNKLNKLYREKILVDQNNIQLDIINNQVELIEDYKNNNNRLKLNLDNVTDKFKNVTNSNKNLLIDNSELKNVITRFTNHNKNLQNDIQQLKKNYVDASLVTSKLNESITQIKYYQDENIRLSNEIVKIKKNYETIKQNLHAVEAGKNNIYKKIKELNDSLITNNIIGSPFIKETIIEDSINSKTLNNISKANLKEVNKESNKESNKEEKFKDLNDQVNNIFK